VYTTAWFRNREASSEHDVERTQHVAEYFKLRIDDEGGKVVPKVKREVVIDFDFLSYRLCISKANASLQTHVLQPHTKLEAVSFP